jgi:penicillin-binding protein 1A
MAQSVNCAYIRVGLAVGLDKVVTMGQQLGITTPLQPFISMSIGSEEVRPIDMAGVYATFADDGVHHTPYLVDHVLDRNGNLLLQGGEKGTQVLSPAKAHEELVALRAVVTGGTGTAASLPDRPVAGKTGTAENNDNAWFDGVTPQLTTVVWMGSPIGNIPMNSVGGYTGSGKYEYYRTVFGGTYPAMIWHEYTQLALAGQPAIDFPKPDPYDMGNIFTVKDPPGSYSSFNTTPARRSSTPTSTAAGTHPATTAGTGTGTGTGTGSGGGPGTVPATEPPTSAPAGKHK